MASKYDRIAESTLYHEAEEDFRQHGFGLGKNNYTEEEYLLPNEEEGERYVHCFDPKGSTGKNSKNAEVKKKTKAKRVGSSEKRHGNGKATQLRKAGK